MIPVPSLFSNDTETITLLFNHLGLTNLTSDGNTMEVDHLMTLNVRIAIQDALSNMISAYQEQIPLSPETTRHLEGLIATMVRKVNERNMLCYVNA